MTGTEPGDPAEVLLHTVGRPLAGVEMMIVDETGTEVPHGETGIIRMRTRCQMRGYWNDPERSAEAMSDDGWIQTGDLGFFRDDGNLVLCGRSTEMYIRGGYNVYPLEVENVLAEHPGVDRVAVLGIARAGDRRDRRRVRRRPRPASPPTADELKRVVPRTPRRLQDARPRGVPRRDALHHHDDENRQEGTPRGPDSNNEPASAGGPIHVC